MNWTEEDFSAYLARKGVNDVCAAMGRRNDKKAREKAVQGEKRAVKCILRVSEADEQKAFLDMCRLHEKKYPDLALIRSIPNGGYRHKATATKMKREGQKPGVFDLDLPVPRGIYHGLKLKRSSANTRIASGKGIIAMWHGALKRHGRSRNGI